MATAPESTIPIREAVAEGGEVKKAATEQQIDPWEVQAAQDEDGNALAFDYTAISECARSF